jgi:hypothetical protein
MGNSRRPQMSDVTLPAVGCNDLWRRMRGTKSKFPINDVRRTIWLAGALAGALAVWGIVLALAAAPARAQDADEDPQITYLRTLLQIDMCGETLDMDRLDQLANSVQHDWPEFDPERYGKLMLEVAQILETKPFTDEHRRVHASQYAAQALATSGAVMSMDTQISLVQCVDDHDLSGTLEWSVIRTRDAKLWLAIWQEAADAIDPTFSPDRDGPRVVTPAPPLPGINNDNADTTDSAAAPESASDRAFRQELAGNAKSAVRFVQQTQARQRLARFVPAAEKALIALYSQPPDKQQDLTVYLRINISDAAARQTILDAVAKNLANPPPPATQSTTQP